MSTQDRSATTALVTGASRGFGRAIAIALSQHGAQVVGVARDRARLAELRAQLGDTFTPVAADAADPVAAGQLLDQHRPRTLVLNAGAAPLTRPIHRQTWQTFSVNSFALAGRFDEANAMARDMLGSADLAPEQRRRLYRRLIDSPFQAE